MQTQKLNTKRVIFVGFAFFLITAFWQAYDAIVPLMLTNRFGLPQTASGAIMALDNVFALYDFSRAGVEIGILAAVPKVNAVYIKCLLCRSSRAACNLVAFGIGDGVADRLSLGKILYKYFYLNLRVSAVDSGSDDQACAAEIIKVEMRLAYANKIYVTVKTAVEGEVCHLGVNLLVGSVVNYDRDLGLVADLVGDVDAPG